MGHIGCDYALQVLQQSAIIPGRPRCQDGRVCVLRPVRLKNLLAFGTIADYQMAEDVGSQWGEGPSVLKQFFPLLTCLYTFEGQCAAQVPCCRLRSFLYSFI